MKTAAGNTQVPFDVLN